jgi:hypothetical protein
MAERFVCERCGQAFESSEARCPKCLRKSSVRGAAERGGSSEALQLAAGDHRPTSEARRATALVSSIVGCAALCAPLMLAWTPLVALRIVVPAIVGAVVAGLAWIRGALVTGPDERSWAPFASRAGVGLALGMWAFGSGVIAVGTTSDLSVVFTLAIGVLVFFGGVIPVLGWLRQREDDAPPPTPGKWR